MSSNDADSNRVSPDQTAPFRSSQKWARTVLLIAILRIFNIFTISSIFQVHICEDCETSLAVVYCTDCLNSSDGFGICLCKRCSDLLHTGATRRRHNIAGR